ncbi:hypothetical protein CTEN210_15558 [Chaetoceros tenuissimus]|uniref:Clusterin-associated protein 1 n=1 Tax=Chaetoceros tenuissimus TaxID=426638 RepID=A0AAD3D711_9STRA|nr:hypothetical protein CTEN210_15558 [Chaetoceros tenuissimus]
MKSRSERKELIEVLNKLYYPTEITTETFKHPNFDELAEVLYWFAQRLNPSTTIHTRIDSESDRVEFIKSIVIFFFEVADLRLDTRKLYYADKKCVSELIKVGNFLLDAIDIEKDQAVSTVQQKKIALIEQKKIDRIKYLTSKLTESGANLHSLLQEEAKVEVDRSDFHNVIQSIIEGNEVASTKESDSFRDAMNRILEQKKHDLDILQEEINEIKADMHDLQLNIQRKKEDIERNENRLKSLQSTKPTFLNELKALEDDLQKHYDLYMERYRNIHYLQHELKRLKESEVKNSRKLQLAEDQRGILLDNNKMPSPTKSEEASTHSSNANSVIVIDEESSHQTSSKLSSNASGSHLGSTSNSSTLSISVDTTSSFLQNENEISPISKESSDDSDDDF